MSDTAALGLTVILLLANAFFVAAEFALISARRSAIEPRQGESRAARITVGAMENVSLMLAGAQLGITIASLGLGSIAEPAVAHLIEGPFEAAGLPEQLLHPVAFVIALSIIVFLHVVAGEMIPKNVALAGPDRVAVILAPPLVLVVMILRPLIGGLNLLANVSLRAVRVTPKDEVTSAFTREEVVALFEESRREGLLDDEEHDLLSGALSIDERTAASVLLPIDSLETVELGATPRDVEGVAARTGYSRFPVRGHTGDLVGYLHLKDCLETDPVLRGQPIAAKRVRAMPHVGEDDTLREVIALLQREGSHLARVTDAAGEVLGVVALEDVLEELVGEIRDETQPVGRA